MRLRSSSSVLGKSRIRRPRGTWPSAPCLRPCGAALVFFSSIVRPLCGVIHFRSISVVFCFQMKPFPLPTNLRQASHGVASGVAPLPPSPLSLPFSLRHPPSFRPAGAQITPGEFFHRSATRLRLPRDRNGSAGGMGGRGGAGEKVHPARWPWIS